MRYVIAMWIRFRLASSGGECPRLTSDSVVVVGVLSKTVVHTTHTSKTKNLLKIEIEREDISRLAFEVREPKDATGTRDDGLVDVMKTYL